MTPFYCLQCGKLYTPNPQESAQDYPYCLDCNLKQTQDLLKLQEINLYATDSKRPGKRQKKQRLTELVKRRKLMNDNDK